MSPQAFIEKYRAATTGERATAQSHFNDLCDLLGEPKPLDADPTGESYAFEKGASKTGGGDGWADVWRRHCFAWEYKGKHKDLDKALAQVKQYAAALENPPLLVACDIERIVVTTNWTNTVSVRREIKLEDLRTTLARDFLKKVLRGDESLKTGETRQTLTAKVAREFAALAGELQGAGHEPLLVAHFVNRLVFCMYAEDAGLLGDGLFTKMLEAARRDPERFVGYAREIFAAMSKGGEVNYQRIDWFNGGLFEDDDVLPLTRQGIDRVLAAARLDWSAIDPSILGTLFERGLDPAKRSQLGAHYTDPENIMRIVEPVLLRPLREEWERAKALIRLAKRPLDKRKGFDAYLARLRGVTVLDPACGSGNFLYLALRGLKDLEHLVLLEAEALGLERQYPQLGPEVLRGIEINPYAAELARVSIWIGELQWQLDHGFNVDRKPVLKPLATIQNRDALLSYGQDSSPLGEGRVGVDGVPAPPPSPTEAPWPEAEFIIGNPPFIGDKRMRTELGDEYTETLRRTYKGKVPGGADLVCYWYYRLSTAVGVRRAGLVATQMIRSGLNNTVVKHLVGTGWSLFEAWQDEPWHDKGALVRTSIVCLAAPGEEVESLKVDGATVAAINPDLTSGIDIDQARPLKQNAGRTINGVSRAGKFNVEEAMALRWLTDPNPTGVPNSDVLRPTWGADDLGGRWSGEWVIDFGADHTEASASAYAEPFAYVERHVKPVRAENKRKSRRDKWWLFGEPRRAMRMMLSGHLRYAVTGESMVQRFFRWLPIEVLADHKLVVFDAEDDYTLGILESFVHRAWARARSSKQGVVNNDVYPASRVFGSFPFPDPSDEERTAVADAARELDRLREVWLAPPEWTQDETLVFSATVGGPWDAFIPRTATLRSGLPAEARYVRRVPRPEKAKDLSARTLTKLYNDPPAWLRNAHAGLDAAVAEAYRLPESLPTPDLLAALLKLNLDRA